MACDKCLKVEDADNMKNWLRVKTEHSEYRLCPSCQDGFWIAVDDGLPKINTGSCWWKLCNADFNTYDTGCGESFVFCNDDDPMENGFEYCPYCGKELRVK